MQKHIIFMIVGRLALMVSFIFLGTIFVGYPISVVILNYAVGGTLAVLGWWLNKQGEELRDGR